MHLVQSEPNPETPTNAASSEDAGAKAAELVCTSGPSPFIAEGRAVERGDVWIVHLSRDASSLAIGTHAILSFEDDDQPRVIGRIAGVNGNRIELEQRVLRARERRAFPRLIGGLQLSVRALSATEEAGEVAAWTRGDDGPSERGEWFQPDELMNFSVTGLRFDSPPEVLANQILLIDMGVRKFGRWRCVAEVVRVFTEPLDGSSGSGQVAVQFIEIPTDAENALSEMTLAIQESML